MRATTSPQQMAEVLAAARAAGINHIETAPAYGPAEAFLGQALSQWRGSEPLVITSKLLPGHHAGGGQGPTARDLATLGARAARQPGGARPEPA